MTGAQAYRQQYFAYAIYAIYSKNFDRWPNVSRHNVLTLARRIAGRMNRRG